MGTNRPSCFKNKQIMSEKEKTLEGNIKIAKFLGFRPMKFVLDNEEQETIKAGFMLTEEFEEHALAKNSFCEIENLKFHNSWLWLSYLIKVLTKRAISITNCDSDYHQFEKCLEIIDEINREKEEKLYTREEVVECMRQAWIEGYKARDPYNKQPTPFDDFIKRFLNHNT